MTLDSRSRREVILVVEPAPNWLPELQRRFPEYDVRAGDLEEPLATAVPKLLVVDSDSLSGSVARLADRLNSPSWSGRALAILSRSDRGLEWAIRELGFHSAVDWDLPREDVLKTCRRQLKP